jgi:hypothetical protein
VPVVEAESAPLASGRKMERPPHIYLLILRGDSQSFLAAASHYACEKDTKGTPNVYMWDSARGGLQ